MRERKRLRYSNDNIENENELKLNILRKVSISDSEESDEETNENNFNPCCYSLNTLNELINIGKEYKIFNENIKSKHDKYINELKEKLCVISKRKNSSKKQIAILRLKIKASEDKYNEQTIKYKDYHKLSQIIEELEELNSLIGLERFNLFC